jgi:CRP-like cAMP-binding protein
MKNNQNCKICDSKECFLFKNCSPIWHDELSLNKSCVRYRKNQLIFNEGETVQGIYFIQSGKVKVYKETNYRGQIVRFAEDGDILGHRGIGGDNRYPISASTLEDSLICFINQEMLFKLLENNTALSIRMMLFYADELKKTEIRLRNMAVMTVRERVADAILLIQESFGSISKEGNLIDVELSRKDIAEIAGTYPEQVSRYITEFKRNKILDISGKKIIILQSEKLLEMVEKYNMY